MFLPSPIYFYQVNTNNHFKSWLGLTPNIISKHLPPSVAIAQGHLHEERKKLQSTKSAALSKSTLDDIRGHFKELKKKNKVGQLLQDIL